MTFILETHTYAERRMSLKVFRKVPIEQRMKTWRISLRNDRHHDHASWTTMVYHLRAGRATSRGLNASKWTHLATLSLASQCIILRISTAMQSSLKGHHSHEKYIRSKNRSCFQKKRKSTPRATQDPSINRDTSEQKMAPQGSPSPSGAITLLLPKHITRSLPLRLSIHSPRCARSALRIETSPKRSPSTDSERRIKSFPISHRWPPANAVCGVRSLFHLNAMPFDAAEKTRRNAHLMKHIDMKNAARDAWYKGVS